MREIKFRGKSYSDNKWHYGYYFYRFETPFSGERHEITDGAGLGWNCPAATIGQYTCLKDKYGREIYEGDKCAFSVFDYNDCDTQYTGVVVWSGSRFTLWNKADSEYYDADGGFDIDWVRAQDDEFEVIGNIHDEVKEATHE